MRAWWVVVACLMVTSVARADDTPLPKMSAGASAALWLPSGDADDFASTSLGVRPFFTYRVIPWVAVVASFDYIFVNEKDNVADVTYYSISVGGRIAKPRPGRIEPFGELLLGWHKLDAEGVDDSGIGFRIGGGATYPLSGNLIATGGLSYSSVSIDTGGFFSVDIDALVFDVGLGARF